jgi:indolepyruvate ferredoxin oxidoreductase alpha subunit
MRAEKKRLLSGNEAVAYAAREAGFHLGTGYPGTPSTEIVETFSAIGGKAQWAPNEKVALEVAIGVAYGNGRALVTMKHVGLNVAADPLFSMAYTGVAGGLVLAVADDPGMASSQNEQDTRRYAIAAGVPVLDPSDSQEAYDFLFRAVELSEAFGTPVILRLTTRVSHSKGIVQLKPVTLPPRSPCFQRDIPSRVLIPAYARQAHRRLRQRLSQIAEWNENGNLNPVWEGKSDLGIIASGVAALHAREAVPHARLLKLGMCYPFPIRTVRNFVASVGRCLVIEEGDPVIQELCLTHGLSVLEKAEDERFGELKVSRVRRIVNGDCSPQTPVPAGRPPQLCPGCPHRTVFESLRDLECIVAGDIGCYTLGVLPPFEAMDSCTCMGASIGVGLGLRHVLPPDQARRVVSVIGDSTFVHSGLTGIVEMMYNPPPTGHLVLILDNQTTAMTGLQDHPATGRTLSGEPTHQLSLEDVCRAIGVEDVTVYESRPGQKDELRELLRRKLAQAKPCVLIVRRECLLAAKRRKQLSQAAQQEDATC